jgi:hypothetical protein
MAIAVGGWKYRTHGTLEVASSSETGVSLFSNPTNVRVLDGTTSSTSALPSDGTTTATIVLNYDFSALPANAIIESVTFVAYARANRDMSTTNTASLGWIFYKSGPVITVDGSGIIPPNTANTVQDWSTTAAGIYTRADLLTCSMAVQGVADDTVSMTYGVDYIGIRVEYNY